MATKLYQLRILNLYEPHTKCYIKVFGIDREPEGPLKNRVRRHRPSPLSPFRETCDERLVCHYYITDGWGDFMRVKDGVTHLFQYLQNNGYTIETGLTKLMEKSQPFDSSELLCFIQYN